MRDKEKQREYNKRYRKEHAEEIATWQRQYNEEHATERAEWRRTYRELHTEEIRQYRKDNADRTRQYYKEHAEQIAAIHKAYYKQHREEIAAYQRERDKAARDVLRSIKLFYGCSNPACYGPWLPDKLHFHHIDETTKLFNIARGYHSLAMVIAEVNKCLVLCRHCHLVHHKGNLDVSTFRRCILDAGGQPL